MESPDFAGHYVYIYYERDKARYVGYGHHAVRATTHQVLSHNSALNDFIATGQYRVEIAGPFDTEIAGRAVETALISALKPDLNVDPGQARWRFRPLGVPLAFADRITEPALELQGFLSVQGSRPEPVMFVIVTQKSFNDGRFGYDPADPPTDNQIRERVDRWWQVQKMLQHWLVAPQASPGLLVGVFGSPGRQTVIASLHIEREGWSRCECFGSGKISIPTAGPANLDAFGLRGRRISPAAGLRFGGIPSQFYAFLGADGALSRSL